MVKSERHMDQRQTDRQFWREEKVKRKPLPVCVPYSSAITIDINSAVHIVALQLKQSIFVACAIRRGRQQKISNLGNGKLKALSREMRCHPHSSSLHFLASRLRNSARHSRGSGGTNSALWIPAQPVSLNVSGVIEAEAPYLVANIWRVEVSQLYSE